MKNVLKMRVPRNVFLLGLVSFFNDLSAEMIYPIVPIFLITVLHTPVPLVGIIEGIAEATASIGKWLFGAVSDYFQKRKLFIVTGYGFGAVSKILIGLAYSWPLVLFARFIDRVGKGLRTAPRDSLLLESTTSTNRGYIFGFHRAFDSLGAVLGPLAGLALLFFLKENMRLTFFLAFIPSCIAVILLVLFVKDTKLPTTKRRSFVKLDWSKLDTKLRLFLIISFIFAVGNSSDAFILLQAKQLGFSTTLTVLAYVLYNTFQTVFATPAGQIADRVGAKRVFNGGLFIFALVYLGFGLMNNANWLWILFPVYGIYIAMTDGVSKAFISDFITPQESGTYFGFYYTLTAVGTFLASFLGGLLWTYISPSATFFYGSSMAFIAFLLFLMTGNAFKQTGKIEAKVV